MPSLPFWIAALVLALTPGPGLAYVVARTAAGGRGAGLASCIGTGLGGLLHVAAAATGLSLLLAESATALSVAKWVGAAYLVYLGVRMLRAKPSPEVAVTAPIGRARGALVEGIVVEALNVKTALFFLAFLPQFVSDGSPVGVQLVAMGCVCVALNTLVDVAAVFGAARLLGADGFGQQRARRLNQASGVTLIGLGVTLAASRRG